MIATAAPRIGERIRNEDGIANAASLIERYFSPQSVRERVELMPR